jgi:hypothetical protein
LEKTEYNVTFEGTLSEPEIEQGLNLGWSSNNDIVLSSGKFTVRGTVRLSGGKEEVDRWVVGFVQNVTSGAVQAFYGAPGAGSKVTRTFPQESLPLCDPYAGHEKTESWQTRPADQAYAAKNVGTEPQPDEKVVTLTLSPLKDQPNQSFDWTLINDDDDDDDDDGLPLKKITGTTTLQYWIVAVDTLDQTRRVVLDTARWGIRWHTNVTSVKGTVKDRATPVEGSGCSTAVFVDTVQIKYGPPDANDEQFRELTVTPWVAGE